MPSVQANSRDRVSTGRAMTQLRSTQEMFMQSVCERWRLRCAQGVRVRVRVRLGDRTGIRRGVFLARSLCPGLA